MSRRELALEASWKARVGEYFERADMQALGQFLRDQKRAGKVVYPPGAEIFAAFQHTPFTAVKVVILGQDPYHGPGQAQGLSFSVRPGVRIPPSLLNIFAEIKRDLGLPVPDHGCLIPWADRGVLLLNSVLTVERGNAGSHRGRGWEGFTDTVIQTLAQQRTGLVFMLWGSYARSKRRLIDSERHLILQAPHPSPLSAHRGFIGCGHFSQAAAYCQSRGLEPVDWHLPSRAQLVEQLKVSTTT